MHLPPSPDHLHITGPLGMADSKVLTPEVREALYPRILATSVVGVGIASDAVALGIHMPVQL